MRYRRYGSITELSEEFRPVAQKTTVHYVDDLDDDQTAEETVTFGLDGVTYKIDLSAAHAATLREDLATWLDHAHRTSGRTCPARTHRRNAHAHTDRAQTAAIRDWARSNGRTVSDRGRIPAHVLDAFTAAH